MKTLKIILLLLATISIAGTDVLAQQKAGTTSMEFLKVMPCARATALGDAYSTVASGAEAVYWNPAGVAWTNNQEFSLTYINWIFDAKLYDLSYVLPLGSIGNFGVQFTYVDLGSFDETKTDQFLYLGQSYPYMTGRTWKPFESLAGLSYAKKLTDKFSFGITAKYAFESLYDHTLLISEKNVSDSVLHSYKASPDQDVFLFDVGFRYNTGFRTVAIAASAQNFGPDVKYSSTYNEAHYAAPLEFRLGVAGDLIGKNSLLIEDDNNRVGLMFDLFLANDATQQEHLGIEYEFANTVAVRLGYKFNYSTEGFTAGAGIHQTLGNIRVSFDYSYGAMDAMISQYAGNVHRISLGVGIL